MSNFKKLWDWCPNPKPVATSHVRLTLLVLAFMLVGFILVANVVPCSNPPGLLIEIPTGFVVQHSKCLVGWNSTGSVPEVNSTVPVSSLVPECLITQTDGVDIWHVGTYVPHDIINNMNITLVNFGQLDVHITSINFYEVGELIWSLNVSGVIPAKTATTINVPFPENSSNYSIHAGFGPSNVEASDIREFGFQELLQECRQTIQTYSVWWGTIEVETLEGYTTTFNGMF